MPEKSLKTRAMGGPTAELIGALAAQPCGVDFRQRGPAVLTKREITGVAAAVLLMAVGAWFWVTDLRDRAIGEPVTGIYSGSYEHVTSHSKFGGDNTAAELLLDITLPDGQTRRVRLLDRTDFADLPEAGAEIPLLWSATSPDTARSAEALSGPIGQNAAWAFGIGVFLFVANLWDVIGRRRRAG